MILNERVLRLIVTLADELHFGRAAATLHVSQPALSGSVKALERDLGVQLFLRTSRNVQLTEAGRILAAEASHLIQDGERAVARVRGSSSSLQVGYPATINLQWLSRLMARTRAEGFQFISTEPAKLAENLIKRRLHASFLSGSVCHPDIQCATLFREAFAVVLASGHPLARYKSLHLDQLQDEPVVWIRDSTSWPQDHQPNLVQEVRTWQECLAFAQAGLGITFLPTFMEREATDSVVFVPLPEFHVEYKLAYWRNGAPPEVERFLKLAIDQQYPSL